MRVLTMPNMKPEKTPMPAQDPIVRSKNFEEVEYGYTHEMALEEALENLKRATRRYAKRQLTWFRRDPEIRWFRPDDDAAMINYIDFGKS